MYSFSRNEENYHGEFETREGAIEKAKAEGLKRFWTGENVTPDPLDYIDGCDIVENIVCQDEFSGDWAEGWPMTTKEQDEELTEMLRAAFKAWMDKHGLHPTFWNVENVQEHAVENTAA